MFTSNSPLNYTAVCFYYYITTQHNLKGSIYKAPSHQNGIPIKIAHIHCCWCWCGWRWYYLLLLFVIISQFTSRWNSFHWNSIALVRLTWRLAISTFPNAKFIQRMRKYTTCIRLNKSWRFISIDFWLEIGNFDTNMKIYWENEIVSISCAICAKWRFLFEFGAQYTDFFMCVHIFGFAWIVYVNINSAFLTF